MDYYSIIVPCYNCQRTLKKCIESLCSQKYDKLEILLVDDGSTDQTPVICDEYAAEDNRIKVIHKENGGLVSAWKAGTKEAAGQYILFCDSDDYVDNDLTQTINDAVRNYNSSPDLILYGMVIEYDNGTNVLKKNRLGEGFYDCDRIKTEILPVLLSNGKMESELIQNSRCTKAFKREVLLNVMDDIPDKIRNGEDALTTFLFMLNAKSVLCLENYFPYHYVRNSGSMIGVYNPNVFERLDELFDAMWEVSDKYNYLYKEQRYASRLSMTLLYLKKEISRNPNGYFTIRRNLAKIRKSDSFEKCIENTSIGDYSFSSRLFATLIIQRLFFLAYCSVKANDTFRDTAK